MEECLRATTSRGLLNVLKDFSQIYFFVLSVNHPVHKISPISSETRLHWLTVWPMAGDWWLMAGTLTEGISTVLRCFDVRLSGWFIESVRLIDWVNDPWLIRREFCSGRLFIYSNEEHLQKFTSFRDAVWNFKERPNGKKIILLVLKRQL